MRALFVRWVLSQDEVLEDTHQAPSLPAAEARIAAQADSNHRLPMWIEWLDTLRFKCLL